MDLEKLEYYEFLDLSDIDEHERQQLKQTLFSEGTPQFLQLPWTNQASQEWQKETYGSDATPLPNGPPNPSGSPHDAMVGQDRGGPPMAQPMQPVTIYSPPALPAYTMPPPSTGYQHPQNVFVTNVTANVHATMPPHYVQQHYPVPEQPEISGRGHRGRGRSRVSKRTDCRMEGTIVETTSTQPYAPQYVQMYYHPAYYTQPINSPIQPPNPQHAPASPLYIPPMYPVYGAYHPTGPQYYPPPHTAHVNTVMEDSADMSELNLGHNTQEESVYQHQISEEDYDTSQNVVTTVIVNSNIDTSNCEVKSNNSSAFLNNNHIKVTEPVITDTHCNIKPVANTTTTKPPVITSSVVNIKNETVQSKLSVNVTNTVENNEVTTNVKSVVQHVIASETDTVTNVHKVVPSQTLPAADVAIVHKNTPAEAKATKVVAPTVSESTSVKDASQSQMQVPPPTSRSWASLFSDKSSNCAAENSLSDSTKSPSKPVTAETSKTEDEKQTGTTPSELNSTQKSAYTNDPVSHRMGEFLSKYTLENRTVSLQPRGLTNRSNYCYINSILQALLACPLFYNLLKALPHQSRKNGTGKSPTPIIDSMVEFVNEFLPLPAGARLNRKEKGQRKDDNIDVPCGTAFEPSWIYKILNGIRSDTFIVEGRQEDAEEFFGCLLNGLNDEMLELIKLADGGVQNSSNKSLSNGDIVSNGDTNDQDEDEWKVMGPKNKGSVTRRAEFDGSPISDIFRGQLRSRVHRTNSRGQVQVTDNVQPFFTLQLDIEKANSVAEALEALVQKDTLEGVTCSKTNQQVEAWQQVTVEKLPRVMVLHLKCFNYKLDACSKIIKAVEFPIDLKIDSKLLFAKNNHSVKERQYKLFAVVYHDGKEASKGHYLTDAYHVGYGGWVRYDDSTVKSVNEAHVLHPSAARVPYLLFYRRCDTIGNQPSSKKD